MEWEHVLQHRLVQRSPRHPLLEPQVLLLPLSHLPNLIHFQTRVLGLPAIKRLLADRSLPDHFRDWNPNLRLLQHAYDLFHTEALLLYLPTLRLQRPGSGRRLTFLLAQE
jgi:hypothetical protein